jgi:oligoendopeptidase F
MGYMDDVREELVSLYADIPASVLATQNKVWTESQMFSYVESTANNMGGIIQQAFTVMKDGGYYDIAYGPNKYNASFETFLPYYYVPFVFVNPQGNAADPMAFAHEFGHFCNDYAASGTVCGIDVAEVFSQGMEYLSLFYAEGGEALKELKLAGSLSTFVEQSAYAQFEHQLYLLETPTVENVRALYAATAEAYGFAELGYDSRGYISISHFYVAPMYIVSYVLSNDLAMQIYQAEDTAAGAGKKLFEDNLTTEEVSIIAFMKSAGLQDPFATDRVARLRETFEKVLG